MRRSLLCVVGFFCSLTSVCSQDVLVFYHIPKCGGTTVAALVGEKFHTSEVFHQRMKKDQGFSETNIGPLHTTKGGHPLQLDRIDWGKTKYVHGHIDYSEKADLPQFKNFTFLRDPVERVFSAYRYIKQYRKGEVDFYELYNNISNLQVYRLSSLCKQDPNISLREHLESAKQTLAERFFFVGIVEEMSASLTALYKLLDWEPPTITPAFNITKQNRLHDPILYAFVSQREWADRELYEYAKMLLAKHVERAKTLTISPRSVDYAEAIYFNVDQPLDGEGWGYRELDLETKTAVRQSYLEDAFINFPILKQDYVMKFKALFPEEKMIKNFQILVNGKKLPYEYNSKGKWTNIKLKVPRKHIIYGKKTKITFRMPEFYVPSEHGDWPDHRKLGIGISEISIQPKYHPPIPK